MGILVSDNRDGYPHEIFYPAIELAQGGFIEAVDLEKVSVYYDGTNMTVRSVRQT